MFSALRLRVLEFMSPRQARNDESSRSLLQSPLHTVKHGRVSKASSSKPQKLPNSQHLMDRALESVGTENDNNSLCSGGILADGSVTDDDTTIKTETLSERTTPMTSPSTSGFNEKNTTPISKDTKHKAIEYQDHDATGGESSSGDGFDDRRGSMAPKLTKAEQTEHVLGVEVEGSEVRKAIVKEDHPGWSQSEIDLYNKLNMRGFQPLLPTPWHMDFPTFPPVLFSSNNERVFIKSLCGKDFRAQRSLALLISLGARVRDRLRNKLAPVPTITRELRNYIKWSHEDACLDKCNPISALALVSANKGESVASVVSRAREKMHELGRQYREEFRVPPNDKDEEEFEPLPTIYGLIVIHTVVSVVTYNSSVVGKEIRALALFDFGIEQQDVWNSFAVAILVVWVRDYLVSLSWAEVASTIEEEDPDA